MDAAGRLLSALRERVRRDSEFASWLESLWSELGPAIRDSGRSANVISGTVHGNVIQARDVNGGIHQSHSHGGGSKEDGNAG